jgi:predicted O-methyltransferase YrrM
MTIQSLISKALVTFGKETESLLPIIERRYDLKVFPSTGQYDWFSAQVLYCLIRLIRPEVIIEVSTSSGYSTLIQANALLQNGSGQIHTFELNPNLAKSAQSVLNQFRVADVVSIHVGDARAMCDRIPKLSENCLLFLDSLHTADFAKWFMRRWVLGAPKGTLLQVHDCMPDGARVRFDGGPPWRKTRFGRLHDIGRRILGKPTAHQLGHTVRRCVPVFGEQILPCTDGVFTTEALLMNQLTQQMEPSKYCYLHGLSSSYPELRPSRFDHLARKRQSYKGEPMEWNETLWMDAAAVALTYKREFEVDTEFR